MIFGFNTDIRHEGTIYHVQSEAREAELLLQTQVFVRGRCVGKRAISYAEMTSGGYGQKDQEKDQQKEQMLREQHRLMLDSIRDGRLDAMLDKRDTPETLAQIKELNVVWVNSSFQTQQDLMLCLRVTDGTSPAEGARITVRLARPDCPPSYSQVTTNTQGDAELRIAAPENSWHHASVLVQAAYSGSSVTRSFQLRRMEA